MLVINSTVFAMLSNSDVEQNYAAAFILSASKFKLIAMICNIYTYQISYIYIIIYTYIYVEYGMSIAGIRTHICLF